MLSSKHQKFYYSRACSCLKKKLVGILYLFFHALMFSILNTQFLAVFLIWNKWQIHSHSFFYILLLHFKYEFLWMKKFLIDWLLGSTGSNKEILLVLDRISQHDFSWTPINQINEEQIACKLEPDQSFLKCRSLSVIQCHVMKIERRQAPKESDITHPDGIGRHCSIETQARRFSSTHLTKWHMWQC